MVARRVFLLGKQEDNLPYLLPPIHHGDYFGTYLGIDESALALLRRCGAVMKAAAKLSSK